MEGSMDQVTAIASNGVHQKEIFTEVLIDRSTMERMAPKRGGKKDNRTLKVFSAILSGIAKYRSALLCHSSFYCVCPCPAWCKGSCACVQGIVRRGEGGLGRHCDLVRHQLPSEWWAEMVKTSHAVCFTIRRSRCTCRQRCCR